MYLGADQKTKLIEQGILRGDEACLLCSQASVVFWSLGDLQLFLCGEHAQYLGTHLLKDVRSYEIATHQSVKVRMETRAHSDWKLE